MFTYLLLDYLCLPLHPSYTLFLLVTTHKKQKQATEQKKEAFRKYLESAGVIDSLTKVLVSLYEEPDKPATAIDFLKANLGGPTPAEFEALTEEKNALAQELETCKKELAEAQARLEAADGAGEDPAAPAE